MIYHKMNMFVHITHLVIENILFLFFHFVAILFCVGGIVRDLVSDFPRTFERMVLHVSDVSVIGNRESNRYFEHTKICIQRCNFPHMQFC